MGKWVEAVVRAALVVVPDAELDHRTLLLGVRLTGGSN